MITAPARQAASLIRGILTSTLLLSCARTRKCSRNTEQYASLVSRLAPPPALIIMQEPKLVVGRAWRRGWPAVLSACAACHGCSDMLGHARYCALPGTMEH